MKNWKDLQYFFTSFMNITKVKNENAEHIVPERVLIAVFILVATPVTQHVNQPTMAIKCILLHLE